MSFNIRPIPRNQSRLCAFAVPPLSNVQWIALSSSDSLELGTMSRYAQLALVGLMLISAAVAYAEAPDGYPFKPFDEAMRQAQDEGKPLFVYFGRYGCGYCEKTNKEAFSDEMVRVRYTDHYALAYVDAEGGERLRLPSGERITERELGTRYDAFVTPVFSFMTPEGELVLRLVGVQRIEDLLEADARIQEALAAMGAS
jgi:thioredoxin-related protein